MKAQEEFILFLEEYPELHPLTKSRLCMSFIETLARQGKTRTEISRSFSTMEKKDLDLILDSLLKLGVVKKIRAAKKVVYYTDSLGKTLLEKYYKARKQFSAFE